MPASTPIYGIPYPCPGETIDATVFANFANAVNAAVISVNTLSDSALNRPTAQVYANGTPTVLASGVLTVITFTTEIWDNDGLANLGPFPTRLTVVTPGTYMVTYSDVITGGATTTSGTFALSKTGTVGYRIKEGNPSNAPVACNVSGIFDAVPGDFFQAFAIWNGTGGPGSASQGRLTCTLVNRP